MDINALQVVNHLFRLRLGRGVLKRIEEEAKHTERTGLYIGAVRRGHAVCVDHDHRNHPIVIKPLEEFGEFGRRVKPNTRVLFKTLVLFDDLPDEIYTLHRIGAYRTDDSRVRFVARNLNELKERIIDRFADRTYELASSLIRYYYDYHSYYLSEEEERAIREELEEEVRRELKALWWLFGEDFDGFRLPDAGFRPNISRIIKVFQTKNRRLAVFMTCEDFERVRGGLFSWRRWKQRIRRTTFRIRAFTPRNPAYNYVCPNREVYIRDGHGRSCEVWIDGCDVGEEELRVLADRLGDGTHILTPDLLNELKREVRLKLIEARRREIEQRAREEFRRRVEEQFRNGGVVRHGIRFTQNSVSYEGITIRGERLGDYLVAQSVIWQERPDFRRIYEGYIEYLLRPEVKYSYFTDRHKVVFRFEGRARLSVGRLHLTLTRDRGGFWVKVRGFRRHRIGKEDVEAVLKKAIEYANRPREFDEFLRRTSRWNLRLQRVIERGGLDFVIKISSYDNPLIEKDEKIRLVIPVRLEGGRLYAVVGGRKHRIRNSRALLDLGREVDEWRLRDGYLNRVIRLLYRAIDGLTPEKVGNLIAEGRRAYRRMVAREERERRKKVERSLKFLERAVKLTGARRVDGGYLVRGESGTIYFVEDDLRVWTTKRDNGRLVPDRYLCLLDTGTDTSTEWGRNDALAKRLLALSKDRKVAGEIYDAGDRMDRWWNDIREVRA